MINQATAKKLAELYIEATGLVVSLSNLIKYNNIPNSELHIEQATEFIERDDFYCIAVNNLLDRESTKQSAYAEDDDYL